MRKCCEYCKHYEEDYEIHCESCRGENQELDFRNFELSEWLKEMQRLARIGEATEKAFENFGAITGISFNKKNENKRYFIDFEKTRDFYSTKDLLEWSELQQDAEEIERARKGKWHNCDDILKELDESEECE